MSYGLMPQPPLSESPTLSQGPIPTDSTLVDKAANETTAPFGPQTPLGQPIAPPKKEAEEETGFRAEHGPHPSAWESFIAQPIREELHTLIPPKWPEVQGRMLAPDVANKLFEDREVPYTSAVDENILIMERNDAYKRRDNAEWAAQRPMTTAGRVASTAAGFVGSLINPTNLVIGGMSGGLADLLPIGAPFAAKLGAHYGSNVLGFTGTDLLRNYIEQQYGAKPRSVGQALEENLAPAALMTGVGLLARAALKRGARRFLNEQGGTPERDIKGVKDNVTTLDNNEKIQPPPFRPILNDRANGASVGPSGEKIPATIVTSPLETAKLYGATHSDGTPVVHEHNLGPGTERQLTDNRQRAANSVARASDTPGQVHEATLPEGSKLLDIDKSVAEDIGSPESLLKAIEEKTGIPLEAAASRGTTVKDIIANLGDMAGGEFEKGKVVPEDILAQIQEIAKSKGYSGYQFSGLDEQGNVTSRVAHVFEADKLQMGESHVADPKSTPDIYSQAPEETPGPKSAGAIEGEKAKQQNYDPNIQAALDKIKKTARTLHPDEMDNQINEMQASLDEHKARLQELSKESPAAKEELDALREDEAHDKRMMDVAKRIMNCGESE